MIHFDNFNTPMLKSIKNSLFNNNSLSFFQLNPGDSPSKDHSIYFYHLLYSQNQQAHSIFIKFYMACNAHQIFSRKIQRSMEIMQDKVLLIHLCLINFLIAGLKQGVGNNFIKKKKINKQLRNLSTPSFLYSHNLCRDTTWISLSYHPEYIHIFIDTLREV